MALRKIVRNRPSLSCSACRRRKIKCEKQRPACANCVRLGDECVYESEAEHREKAAAKKRKVSLDHDFDLDGHGHGHGHDHDHDDLLDPGRRASSTASPASDPEPPAADPEPAGGWTTSPQCWPPPPPANGTSPGLDTLAQWDAPGLDFDFDFELDLLTPSLSLSSFHPDGSCTLTGSEPLTAHSRRGSPPPPTSGAATPPFEGHVSTQEDGSKLFVERTFWALVSRDASISFRPPFYPSRRTRRAHC